MHMYKSLPLLLLSVSESISIACSGETVLHNATGSVRVDFDTTGASAVACTLVLHTASPSVTLRFSSFDLQTGSTCKTSDAHVHVYDGTTPLALMLASFTCENAWDVAATGGSALVEVSAVAEQKGGFNLTWEPTSASCGNGVCENSADEYDLCVTDCNADERPLPEMSLQHSDTMWCPEDYDRFIARTSSEEVAVQYTVAHFGPPLPAAGLYLDVAKVSPNDACQSITSVDRMGGNTSGLRSPHLRNGTAYLATIFSCHFIDKAIHIEGAGGKLAIVANAQEQLFYMAAAESRQLDSRALDIPSILIGTNGRSWIEGRMNQGVILEVGTGARRCSGGTTLTAPTGTFSSGPSNKNYCAWQNCMWHVTVDADDILVLTFGRHDLECITNPVMPDSITGVDAKLAAAEAGTYIPYDFVKVYDGITASAPRIGLFFCTYSRTVVTSGPHLLLHFSSDDYYNFAGFEASYATGEIYCAAHASCAACATDAHCAFCRTSHQCVPTTGPKAACSGGSGGLSPWSYNTSSCCADGYSGLRCDVCAPGRYGSSCLPCLCGAGGECSEGLSGDGSCSCVAGWTGTLCDRCEPDYWGAMCQPCDCTGGSYCHDSLNGTGCHCSAGHYGSSCVDCSCAQNATFSTQARCADGDHGDGSCSCEAGFRGVEIG